MTVDMHLFVAHNYFETEWHNSLGYAGPITLRIADEAHACAC